jgi:phosphodiesterase/alkaline phosphatase D-like protein
MASLVQAKTVEQTVGEVTELAVTFDAAPTAGNLILVAVSSDRDVNDWLEMPVDTNVLMGQPAASVSTAWVWRAASGTEGEFRFKWRVPRQWVSLAAVELSGADVTNPALDDLEVRAYSDAVASTVQLGPVGPSSAAGSAVAVVSIDSAQGIWNPTATGYTRHALCAPAGTAPGLALFEKAVAPGATENPTVTSGGVTDQKGAAIALFKAGALAAPVWTADPSISSRWGVAETGMVLTCLPGVVAGTPTPDRAYQWKRGGVNISGATSKTYTVQAADVGTTLTCTVMATNSQGSSQRTTSGLAATAPTPHADMGPWSGGVLQDRIRVAYKLTQGTNCRLVVSTASDLSSPVYSATETADAALVVMLEKTGLLADTRYFYGLEVDGTLVPDVESRGEFYTLAPAGTPKSFSFLWGSCILPFADPGTFTAMAASGARFAEQCGDFHYGDVNGETETQRTELEAEWDGVQSRDRLRGWLAKMPVGHSWDDHDFIGNGSSGEGVANRIVAQVERHRVPSHDLPDLATDGGIYRSYVTGRVRVVVIDTRTYRSPLAATDNSSKKLLGDTQEAWWKAELLAAKAAGQMTFCVSSMVWHSNVSDDDVWADYGTERQRLIDWCVANDIVNLMWLCGDAHMIAADDGTNSPGGFATAQAAGIANFGAFKGGPWSEGSRVDQNKYGQVTVTDTGAATVDVLVELKNDSGVTEIDLAEIYTLGLPGEGLSGGLVFTGQLGTPDSRFAKTQFGVPGDPDIAGPVVPPMQPEFTNRLGTPDSRFRWIVLGVAPAELDAPVGRIEGSTALTGLVDGSTVLSGPVEGSTVLAGVVE